MSMDQAEYWIDAVALIGTFIGLRIIAYFVLRWKLHMIRQIGVNRKGKVTFHVELLLERIQKDACVIFKFYKAIHKKENIYQFFLLHFKKEKNKNKTKQIETILQPQVHYGITVEIMLYYIGSLIIL